MVKKFSRFFTVLLIMLFSFISFLSFANTKVFGAAVEHSGINGECSWEINDDGVLRIFPTNGKSGTLDNITYANNSSSAPWFQYKDLILKVVVEDGVFTNTNASGLFFDLNKCTEMDLFGLNTSKTTSFIAMFNDCLSLTSLDLSNFNTASAITMNSMFKNCESIVELNLKNFNTSNVINMGNMFQGCKALINLDITSFNTSKVTWMSYMFYYCRSLNSLDLSNFNTKKVSNMANMFDTCDSLTNLNVSSFDTSNVSNMTAMFSNCRKLSEIDVSNFDVSNVVNMSALFNNCSALINLDLKNFKTISVTNFSYIFNGCTLLKSLDISNFDTSKATLMNNMFAFCSSLEKLDVSKFDTTSATNLSYMFCNCKKLTELHVLNFNTENTVNMSYMFSGCRNLTSLDLSNFDTNNVTNMKEMFSFCSGLEKLNLSNFDTNKLTQFENMFKESANIKRVALGQKFKFYSPLITDNWVKIKRLNGSKTYDKTVYTASELMEFDFSTTPSIDGIWARFGVDDYIKSDEYIEYISDDEDWEMISDTVWTYTFKVFDDSLTYHLFEKILKGYASVAMEPYYITIYDKQGTIVNTAEHKDVKKLVVTKTVEGNPLTNDEFEFIITLSGDKISGIQVFDGIIFKDGIGKFYLKGGENKIFENIPIGTTYKIEEKGYSNYTCSIDNPDGLIASNKINIVNITNTYIKEPEHDPDAVNITLKKIVSDNCNKNTQFTISGYFTGLKPNKEYFLSNGESFTTSSNGIGFCDVKLFPDESVIFLNLPVNSTYQFTEHANDYIPSYNITNDIGGENIIKPNNANTKNNSSLSTGTEIIGKDENIVVEFNSDIETIQNLTIIKSVKEELFNGQLVDYDTDESFEFTINFSNIPDGMMFSSSIGKVKPDEDGTAFKTFNLKNGESIVFYNIPVGIQYTVEESANEYKSSYDIVGITVVDESKINNSVNQKLSTELETVDANESGIVTFTNIKNSKRITTMVSSGGTGKTITVVVGISFAIVVALLVAIAKRKERFSANN